MEQKQLSKRAGITDRYVSYLKLGRRSFTSNMATRFEAVTGIPREMWVYPEIFGNPWAELARTDEPMMTRRLARLSELREGMRGLLDSWLQSTT